MNMTPPNIPAQPKKIARVEIDREACISAGSCVALASKTFDLDDDGKVRLLDPKGDTDELIMEAARSCPVDAVRLYDESGKQLWPKLIS